MSKSKKNFPDPMKVVETYGSDALRIYLLSSPAVHGESINFRERDVVEYSRQVIIPVYNSVQFLSTSIDIYKMYHGSYHFDMEGFRCGNDFLDKWIISYTHSFLENSAVNMESYEIYKVIPKIPKFIENLNNYYIKINRPRLKVIL